MLNEPIHSRYLERIGFLPVGKYNRFTIGRQDRRLENITQLLEYIHNWGFALCSSFDSVATLINAYRALGTNYAVKAFCY